MGLIKLQTSNIHHDTSNSQRIDLTKRSAPYNFKKEMSVILTDPMNYLRAIKCIFHLAIGYLIGGAGSLFRCESLQKRAISQKIQAHHEMCKMAAVWAQSKFGDKILVPARNIGKLENNESIRNKISEFFKHFNELPEIKKLSKKIQILKSSYNHTL